MAASYMKELTILPVLIYVGGFFSLLLPIFLASASTTTPTKEANALLKWKDNLQSQNHSLLPSWTLPVARGHLNFPFHCSNWVGVSCSKVGRTVGINTSNLGLTGTLDSFPFSSLQNLFTLDLSSNALFGTVPAHIANLSELYYMDLSNNQFVGEVPFGIGQLASLQTLHLNGNNFKGSIPIVLCNLTNLVSLDLYANQFYGTLPSDITNLKSLQVLDVSENNLTGPIPSFLGNLTNLTALSINTNQFSGPIPLEIGNLRSIVTLDLSANNLNGSIPYSLFSLGNLTNLLLSKSGLSGSIPVEIGNLSSLARLELFSNSLTGSIPSSIGKLTKLVTLYVHKNNLSGSIPCEIGNLKYLENIRCNENDLNGSIPTEFENLKSLEYLDLSLNSLSGSLPSLSDFQNLSTLALMINQLSGVIPQDFSMLKKLTSVFLSENKFSGVLPDFCSGGILQKFIANNNKFSGPIPNSMKNCPTLVRVRLERNQLHGNMSEVFGIYPRLVYIDLSFNKLYGEMSNNWCECKDLMRFRFSTNNITGRIPHGFGDLTKLGELDISSNHLRGEIPSDLGKLSSLLHLNLSLNQLSGNLPNEIGGLNFLETLDLSANDLSGPIPEEIGDCSQLLHLDLSKNSFRGRIPFHIGNLVYLQVLLDLSQNMFSGEIPSELSELKSLEKLNLSHNMLSGSIPSSLENMSSLMFVDISYNALEGPVPNNKAFREASEQNFGNNKGLCGSIKALGPCIFPEISSGRRGGARWIVQILLPSIFGFLLVVLVFMGCYSAFYKKRNESVEGRKKMDKNHIFGIGHYNGTIVYEDILEATEGFSNKHCIGVGSYGSVYKAELSTGQVVAVKKFHQLRKNEVDKSFETEIRALVELKHRNIVKLHGFCSHVLHSFLVYEYLERGSLAKILSNMEEATSLDWTKRINVTKSIAKALCYMHHGCASPIIHRDISSKNILLDSEFDAYVADFGIARVLEQYSSNLTTIAGTYGYIAPGNPLDYSYFLFLSHFFPLISSFSPLNLYILLSSRAISNESVPDFCSVSKVTEILFQQLFFVSAEFAYTMKLTEKCDVFSFGVLTLEVLMGRHPGDFVSLIVDTTSTPSRIKMLMMKMLDNRLLPPISSIYQEILRISELAFACLNASPESRPTFEFICNELLAYKPSIKDPLDTSKLDNCRGAWV